MVKNKQSGSKKIPNANTINGVRSPVKKIVINEIMAVLMKKTFMDLFFSKKNRQSAKYRCKTA